MKVFDANDWIYQTWAYERHDVGTTPGFDGDTAKALASIKAKTLILTGTKDLLNPEFEPIEAGKNIAGVKMMTISPGTVTGHAAAGGAIPGRCRVSQPRDGGVSGCGDRGREEVELRGGAARRRSSRHCEPTGRANARPMTGSAKQSISPPKERMDCFVASLLAMTEIHLDKPSPSRGALRPGR